MLVGRVGRSLAPVGTATAVLLLALVACGTPGAGSHRATTTGPLTTARTAIPVSVENCGVTVTVTKPPARVVTMNQSSTELMLALGLRAHLAGTAYLDDAVLPQFASSYDAIPVLAKEYPSKETLLAADPDFVYAAYTSAFDAEAAGSRADLRALGIGSYLSPAACPDDRKQPLTMARVWGEVMDVATLFGVPDQGKRLVDQQRSQVDAAREQLADADLRAFWWDSATGAPSAGACCGAPGMIMAALGLHNVFAALPGGWADVSWEAVAAADPDVIVLVDASWDSAKDKLEYLRTNAVTKNLRSVRDGHVVTVPFSSTTPGVRNADAITALGTAIRALPSGP